MPAVFTSVRSSSMVWPTLVTRLVLDAGTMASKAPTPLRLCSD